MAKTVNTAFEEFQKDTVNLDPNRSDKAKSSRGWLWSQLSKLDEKEGLEFPFEYTDKNLDYGSFVRKTKIRELDDVDMMFAMKGCNAYYQKYSNDKYNIFTENAHSRLQNLSVDNVLSSLKVVNKLKSALSEIEHYKSAEIHRRSEAVTLNLKSYEWNFDIVPCFYTDTNLYLIPDGNGQWKSTDPRIDQKLVRDTNIYYEGRLLQLIRNLKYWNRYKSATTIGSYLFEQIVINYAKTVPELSIYIDYDIRKFFNYLSNNIYYPVNDPKNLQGNLNTLTFQQQYSISQKAQWAFERAKEAYEFELTDKNQEKAINKWREIFGNKFPQYE